MGLVVSFHLTPTHYLVVSEFDGGTVPWHIVHAWVYAYPSVTPTVAIATIAAAVVGAESMVVNGYQHTVMPAFKPLAVLFSLGFAVRIAHREEYRRRSHAPGNLALLDQVLMLSAQSIENLRVLGNPCRWGRAATAQNCSEGNNEKEKHFHGGMNVVYLLDGCNRSMVSKKIKKNKKQACQNLAEESNLLLNPLRQTAIYKQLDYKTLCQKN